MTNTEYKEWLESLKEGDEFAVDVAYRLSNTEVFDIKKVDRVTKTLIISGSLRWRICDGTRMGSNTWKDKAKPVTHGVLDNVKRNKLSRSLEKLFSPEKIPSYTNEQLESVISILSGDAA